MQHVLTDANAPGQTATVSVDTDTQTLEFTLSEGGGQIYVNPPQWDETHFDNQRYLAINDPQTGETTGYALEYSLYLYEDSVQAVLRLTPKDGSPERVFTLETPLNDLPPLWYYHTDHLGTPKAMTDESQQIVWWADYDPFGKATVTTELVTNNLRFPGQYFDAETGFYYNWNRYYDPTTGRYISSDPIGLNGEINTYGYVFQNPIRHIDPLGLEVTMVCRKVDDWRTDLVGEMKNCAVFVWHWETCDGKKKKVIDRQFSVAANRVPFRQGSTSFTYVEDTNAFNKPGNGNEHHDAPAPSGWTQSQFDQSVINSGTFYQSSEDYDALLGPNSNTAANDIIEDAGGTPPKLKGHGSRTMIAHARKSLSNSSFWRRL